MNGPKIGDPAPDFTLDGPDGSFTLSGHRGERVILLFYPGDARIGSKSSKPREAGLPTLAAAGRAERSSVVRSDPERGLTTGEAAEIIWRSTTTAGSGMNRSRRTAMLASAGLSLALAVAPAALAAVPEGATAITKDMCKDGGYNTFFDRSPDVFAYPNQGQCVAASNHGAFYYVISSYGGGAGAGKVYFKSVG